MWTPKLDTTLRPRYQALVEALGDAIQTGQLRAGERLPTQRELARMLGLSLGTVHRAYDEAERHGWIQGEVGRGTFVRRGRSLDPHFSIEAVAELPPPAIDLTVNFPVRVGELEERLLSESLGAVAGYGDLVTRLREAVPPSERGFAARGAAWVQRWLGLEAEADRVLLAAGAQNALMAIFAATLRPGDLVCTEALTYPGMKAVGTFLNLRMIGLTLDGEGPVPEAFEEVCRKERPQALYTVPTLQTPTAALMGEARRERIAAIARRHDVLIVEDDDDSFMFERPLRPLVTFAPERGVFIADTFKSIVPGLRLAYVVAPLKIVKKIEAMIRTTVLLVSPLLAEVASRCVESAAYEPLLVARRNEIAARQAIVSEILSGQAIQTHTYAHHVWVDLPPPWRIDAFRRQLEGLGVRVASSESFLVDRGPAPHSFRICLGQAPDRGVLRTGLETIRALLERQPLPSMEIL